VKKPKGREARHYEDDEQRLFVFVQVFTPPTGFADHVLTKKRDKAVVSLRQYHSAEKFQDATTGAL